MQLAELQKDLGKPRAGRRGLRKHHREVAHQRGSPARGGAAVRRHGPAAARHLLLAAGAEPEAGRPGSAEPAGRGLQEDRGRRRGAGEVRGASARPATPTPGSRPRPCGSSATRRTWRARRSAKPSESRTRIPQPRHQLAALLQVQRQGRGQGRGAASCIRKSSRWTRRTSPRG